MKEYHYSRDGNCLRVVVGPRVARDFEQFLAVAPGSIRSRPLENTRVLHEALDSLNEHLERAVMVAALSNFLIVAKVAQAARSRRRVRLAQFLIP